MGYFIIGFLFELVLIIATGSFVNGGHYGTASSFALCSVILAIYQSVYIVIWYNHKNRDKI